MISDGDAPTNRTKPTEEGGSERPRMPSHAGRIGRSQTSPFPMNVVQSGCSVHKSKRYLLVLVTTIDARTQVHQPRPFQRPDRSLKADWLVVDERSTSNGAVRQRVDPARPGAGYGFARRQTALSTTLTQGFTTLS